MSVNGTKPTSMGSAQVARFKTQSGHRDQLGEQKEILARHPVALGNTGVTKTRVVVRGVLRRDEAPEDYKRPRGKFLRMQGGAGRGE
jgi:hypothetical protein